MEQEFAHMQQQALCGQLQAQLDVCTQQGQERGETHHSRNSGQQSTTSSGTMESQSPHLPMPPTKTAAEMAMHR